MKELFIPFFIPNFKEIQQELLLAIDHDYKLDKKPHAFIYSQEYMQDHCPIFMNWLMPKNRVPIRMFRYYVTPPHQTLGAHIDGVYPTSPFGMNIPLIGSENTYHIFYDTPKENLHFRLSPGGYLGAWIPKDDSIITPMSEGKEILSPYIVNNEILHGVTSKSDEHRVMFTIRWPLHPTLYRNIEEVMDTSELMLGHE